jgi:ApaG protein
MTALATTSEAVTHNIRVEVESRYHADQSLPVQHHWFFSYTIRITNESRRQVQLVSRHWIITEDGGHVKEVKGEGVVGEQPVLAPNEAFQYTSFCTLRTPNGTMHGTYQMVADNDEQFDIEIAPFILRATVH